MKNGVIRDGSIYRVWVVQEDQNTYIPNYVSTCKQETARDVNKIKLIKQFDKNLTNNNSTDTIFQYGTQFYFGKWQYLVFLNITRFQVIPNRFVRKLYGLDVALRVEV